MGGTNVYAYLLHVHKVFLNGHKVTGTLVDWVGGTEYARERIPFLKFKILNQVNVLPILIN